MEEEISLLDYLRVIREKWLLLTSVFLCFVLVAVVYFNLAPRVYRSESVILPVEPGASGMGGGAAIAAQLMGLSMSTGSSSAKKIEIYLKSRSLQKRIANKKGGGALPGSVRLIPDAANGTLKLVVESKDPKTATRLNAEFLEELQSYINEEEVTKAKKNRKFVGEQLLINEQALLENGKELSNYYQKNNVSAVSSIVDVNLKLSLPDASLPLERVKKDIEDGIDSIKKNQAKLDQSFQSKIVKGVPQQVYLEYLVQKKQLLVTLNAMMAQQYEVAKMEEQRENVLFQVVDEAEEPTSPYMVKIKLIAAGLVMMGFFMALLLVFLVEYGQKMRKKRPVVI